MAKNLTKQKQQYLDSRIKICKLKLQKAKLQQEAKDLKDKIELLEKWQKLKVK